MKTAPIRFAMFLFFLLLSSGAIAQPAQKKVFIQGEVLDSATREPVGNLPIQLYIRKGKEMEVVAETSSNSAGNFSFEQMIDDTVQVGPTTFPITAGGRGYHLTGVEMPLHPVKTISYEAMRGNIYVAKPKPVTYNYGNYQEQKKQAVQVEGMITDSATGQPLGGVKVRALLWDNLLFETQTLENGHFISDTLQLTFSEATTVFFEVEKEGYTTGPKNTRIMPRVTKSGSTISDGMIHFTARLVSKKKSVHLVPHEDH